MNISNHAKNRAWQRLRISDYRLKKLNKDAYKSGIQLSELEDGNLKTWMLNKFGAGISEARLLGGYLFLYGKGKTLITLYKVPSKYQEELYQ